MKKILFIILLNVFALHNAFCTNYLLELAKNVFVVLAVTNQAGKTVGQETSTASRDLGVVYSQYPELIVQKEDSSSAFQFGILDRHPGCQQSDDFYVNSKSSLVTYPKVKILLDAPPTDPNFGNSCYKSNTKINYLANTPYDFDAFSYAQNKTNNNYNFHLYDKWNDRYKIYKTTDFKNILSDSLKSLKEFLPWSYEFIHYENLYGQFPIPEKLFIIRICEKSLDGPLVDTNSFQRTSTVYIDSNNPKYSNAKLLEYLVSKHILKLIANMQDETNHSQAPVVDDSKQNKKIDYFAEFKKTFETPYDGDASIMGDKGRIFSLGDKMTSFIPLGPCILTMKEKIEVFSDFMSGYNNTWSNVPGSYHAPSLLTDLFNKKAIEAEKLLINKYKDKEEDKDNSNESDYKYVASALGGAAAGALLVANKERIKKTLFKVKKPANVNTNNQNRDVELGAVSNPNSSNINNSNTNQIKEVVLQ